MTEPTEWEAPQEKTVWVFSGHHRIWAMQYLQSLSRLLYFIKVHAPNAVIRMEMGNLIRLWRRKQ